MADPNQVRENEPDDEVEEIEEEVCGNYVYIGPLSSDIFRQTFKPVKDAILFAIEVSDSMLSSPSSDTENKGDGNNGSAVTATLKCAYNLMRQRIITNPNDKIGVLLYGTKATKFYDEDENSRGGLSYPHCYLVTDLDIPGAEDVMALRALADAEDGATDILTATDERASMANVLFCANQIFTSKAPNFLSRRLFIVTDQDSPEGSDTRAIKAAAVRARDLFDLGVSIHLFPISRPGREFDTSKFYDVRNASLFFFFLFA